jgi:hypothetical protein
MGRTDHTELVRGSDGRAAAQAAGAAIGATLHRVDPEPEASFVERLRGWDQRRRAAAEAGGCAQILALEPLRIRFGPRWPSIRDKVHTVIGLCLERGLGDADAYVPLGDDLYLLLFGRHDREQGATRARLIAADATARLFGTNPGGTCIAVRPLPLAPAAVVEGATSAEALVERIAEAERPIESRERRLWRELLPGLRPCYAPVLSLRKGLVSIYRAELVDARGTPAAELLEERQGQALRPELDLCLLHHARRALPGLAGRGRKPLLMVPVHYDTVAGMGPRRPYVGLCRRLPSNAWRRLVIELVGLPESLPHRRVQEIVGYLKPFAAGVVCRGAAVPARPERFAHCGVVGLALEAGTLPEHVDGAFDRLRMLAEAARRHRLESMLLGIEDRRLARLAREARIGYLSGPALHAPLERPGRALRLARARAEPQALAGGSA